MTVLPTQASPTRLGRRCGFSSIESSPARRFELSLTYGRMHFLHQTSLSRLLRHAEDKVGALYFAYHTAILSKGMKFENTHVDFLCMLPGNCQ